MESYRDIYNRFVENYRNAIEKIVEQLHWNINLDSIYCIIIGHDGKYESVRACNKMRDTICSQRFVQTQIELGANGYVTIAGYNDEVTPEFVISYKLS